MLTMTDFAMMLFNKTTGSILSQSPKKLRCRLLIRDCHFGAYRLQFISLEKITNLVPQIDYINCEFT